MEVIGRSDLPNGHVLVFAVRNRTTLSSFVLRSRRPIRLPFEILCVDCDGTISRPIAPSAPSPRARVPLIPSA